MNKGFTLIEIILVVGLLGLLLSLALPYYQGYLERGYRVEAIRMLSSAATCQERHRARTGAYDTTQCTGTGNNKKMHYQLSIEPEANTSSMEYTLTAEPVMNQTNDRCGSLSLDQTGARSISGAEENLWKCWSGR